jgi:hypothetical protein
MFVVLGGFFARSGFCIKIIFLKIVGCVDVKIKNFKLIRKFELAFVVKCF